MKRKQHGVEEFVRKLREADALACEVQSEAQICKSLAISKPPPLWAV